MTKITRRNVIQYAVIAFVFLFAPVVLLFRATQKSTGMYRWMDTPGSNIPIPDSVSGQRGFTVCLANDENTIAVAGNPILPQDVYEIQREPAIQLLAMKYYIYAGTIHGRDFREVYQSLNAGMVLNMAFSPVTTTQLAYIAADIPLQLPETFDELFRLAQDASQREKLAGEFAIARDSANAGNYQMAVFLIDTRLGTQAIPKKLCSLSVFKSSEPRHPEEKFITERNANTLVWSADGNALYCTDNGRTSIIKIDMAGNKTAIYTSNNNSGIFSNLYCDNNGYVVFLTGKQINDEQFAYTLLRVNDYGRILSEYAMSFFYPGTSLFEESLYAWIGHEQVGAIRVHADIHEAQLRIVPIKDFTDDQERNASIRRISLHDPNNLQFYYLICGFLPETNEVLIVKKRALKWLEAGHRRVTPWTIENAAAPWVELRRVKIT